MIEPTSPLQRCCFRVQKRKFLLISINHENRPNDSYLNFKASMVVEACSDFGGKS